MVLEAQYPELSQSTTSSKGTTTTTSSDTSSGQELDLATVIKSTNALSSEIILENLLATLMNILVENAGATRGILILPRGDNLLVEATKETESDNVSLLQSLPIDEFARLSAKIVHYVARTRETVILNDAAEADNFNDDSYLQNYSCQSLACTPLINQGKLKGIIYLENNLTKGAFTGKRMALLQTLATQAAISLENAQLYNNITTLNTAYERFVPYQFLSFLNKQSINEYLGYMEPQIKKYSGFIDKYIGDAIMALFPNSADDAVQGALAMLQELKKYNRIRQERNLNPLRIGIGLHTGSLMLGTVGGMSRMDGTVIGDSVNLSSRVEGLTKTYGVSLLITNKTWESLNNPLEYDLRFIGKVQAKGKTKAVSLFEVFSADLPELREAKIATKGKFEQAVLFYHRCSFQEAARLFKECVEYHEDDSAARTYLERLQQDMA
ncbi:MAG TPA: hypothetical protein DC064_09790 [Cyanobacteria bacterium UBA9273]|nr:hypothetical protein [Cyanobacteria bacterium UBA9273]